MADARLRHPDPRVRFEVGDAEHLTLDETFDIAVSGLMLNFANDAERGVAAMRRAVTPDGLAAAYVWDHAGRMELLQHFSTAAATLDPAAHALDEAVRFASWNADHLSALWRAARLRAVRTTAIDIFCQLRGFDDYWLPFLGGQGPAPPTCSHSISTPGPRCATRCERGCPMATDGSLHVRASAWAVQGTR